MRTKTAAASAMECRSYELWQLRHWAKKFLAPHLELEVLEELQEIEEGSREMLSRETSMMVYYSELPLLQKQDWSPRGCPT